jgi:hypothetical protein
MNIREKLIGDKKKLSSDIDDAVEKLDEYVQLIDTLSKKLEIAKGTFEGIKDAIEDSEDNKNNIDSIWLFDYVFNALNEIEE